MQIEVFFKNDNKPYIVESNEKVKKGDKVVVETMRGIELLTAGRCVEDQEVQFKFIRIANGKDISDAKSNELKAKVNLQDVQKIMDDMGFEVKVTLIEYTLDARKMIINFASENRIDFRELVKVLANKYHCKIEMHQIGFRDEVRIKGGIGICGRECCCKSFLTEFDKVSIKMAKNQNLSLSPNKISGLCGKLLCCLAYENDMYSEFNNKMPKLHQIVETPDGQAEVVYNDVLKERVHVKFDSDGYDVKDYALSEIILKDER